MKPEIHPDYHAVIYVDSATGEEWTSRSTQTSQETRDVDFEGHAYAVSVGFDDQGRILEIFTTTSKQGAGLDALIHDAMILASIALQHGATPSDLRRSMSRLGGGLGSAGADDR